MNDDNLRRQTGHVLREKLRQQNEAIAYCRYSFDKDGPPHELPVMMGE